MEINYKDHHATFKNNILNIYNNNNKLLTSNAYSQIIYINEVEDIFIKSIDNMYKSL